MTSDEEFEQFFLAQYDVVHKLLVLTTGDRERATDATQEAFIKAYTKWSKIRRYDSPTAWVRRVAINSAATASGPTSVATARGVGADRRTRNRHRPTPRRCGRGHLLLRLPQRQREIATLFYVDDRSVAEIAAILGLRRHGEVTPRARSRPSSQSSRPRDAAVSGRRRHPPRAAGERRNARRSHTLEQLRPAMQRAPSETHFGGERPPSRGHRRWHRCRRTVGDESPTTHSVPSAAASPVATPPPVPSSTIAIAASEAEAPLVQSPPETIASTTEVPTPVDDGVEAAVEEAPAPAPAPPAPTVDATPTTPPPPPVVEPSAAVEPTTTDTCACDSADHLEPVRRRRRLHRLRRGAHRLDQPAPVSRQRRTMVRHRSKSRSRERRRHLRDPRGTRAGQADVEVQNPAGEPAEHRSTSRRQFLGCRRWPALAAMRRR